MDPEALKRSNEMAKNFGPREFLRFIGFFIGWIFFGLAVALTLLIQFHVQENITSAVFITFVITGMVFPISARFWKPANTVTNWVIGNKDCIIPLQQFPSIHKTVQEHAWYEFLPSLWRLGLLILLAYFVIKYLTK
jgi:hypothetical protein